MKKTRLFALLCALFLLAGCASPATPTEPSTAQETVAPSADTIPSSADTDPEGSILPLPTSDYFHHAMVKPTAEDRCAATGLGRMAETAHGYYCAAGGYLYYADKSNLTEWQLVCNQPNCSHAKRAGCPAALNGSDCVWWKENAIYTMVDSAIRTEDVILTSPGDGSGWEVAYSDANWPYSRNLGLALSYQCTGSGLCLNVAEMGTDGFWDCYLYFIDASGSHQCNFAEDFPDAVYNAPGNDENQARGDMTMGLYRTFPGEGASPYDSDLYRVNPECFEKLEIPEGCSYYGAYLSGDTMIHYHPNDGFYKLDYYGGTEEKIADAAYKDGFGYCLDGEFLIETTVNWQSTAKECKLRYFDGTGWTEVPLPEEFTPETNLRTVALTSDTLFFEDFDIGGALYMVKLGDNQMVKCMDYPDPMIG